VARIWRQVPCAGRELIRSVAQTGGNTHALVSLRGVFFRGVFLANTLPHLINGISSSPFQSPFATPPGVGLSPAIVNVEWGLFNLAVGYVLVCREGRIDLRATPHVAEQGAGFVTMSLMLAHAFGKLHAGLGEA